MLRTRREDQAFVILPRNKVITHPWRRPFHLADRVCLDPIFALCPIQYPFQNGDRIVLNCRSLTLLFELPIRDVLWCQFVDGEVAVRLVKMVEEPRIALESFAFRSPRLISSCANAK